MQCTGADGHREGLHPEHGPQPPAAHLGAACGNHAVAHKLPPQVGALMLCTSYAFALHTTRIEETTRSDITPSVIKGGDKKTCQSFSVQMETPLLALRRSNRREKFA